MAGASASAPCRHVELFLRHSVCSAFPPSITPCVLGLGTTDADRILAAPTPFHVLQVDGSEASLATAIKSAYRRLVLKVPHTRAACAAFGRISGVFRAIRGVLPITVFTAFVDVLEAVEGVSRNMSHRGPDVTEPA